MRIEDVFKLKGFDQLDLVQYSRQARSFRAKGSNIERMSQSSSFGIGVRVIVGGKVGYSYTNSLTDMQRAVERAIALSKLSDNKLELQRYDKYPKVRGMFDKKLLAVDESEVISIMKQGMDRAAQNNADVSYAKIGLSETKVRYMNSLGVDVSRKKTVRTSSIGVNHSSSSGFWSDESTQFEIDFTELAERACEMAKLKAKKGDITSGVQKVIFHPFAFGQLVEFGLIQSFFADNVRRAQSQLAGQLSKKLFDDKLSLYDNQILAGGLCSRACDDDGVPCQNTALIERGVVSNFIYDLISAQKESRQSTGNCARGYNTSANISASNVSIKPGKKDMLSELDKGLLVYNPTNAHTTKPVTGDFSIGCSDGFWVENGEIKFAPKKVMLSGNVLSLLKKIELGNDITQASFDFSAGCYVGPSILAECNVVGS